MYKKFRTPSQQERMKNHYVSVWDGHTACGRDSFLKDLNQALEWNLVACGHCLKRRVKEEPSSPAPANN